MSRPDDLQSVFEGVVAGDVRALARALTWIENGDSLALELETALSARPSADVASAVCIGLTGPPGVGKSSLISRLIPAFRDVGERVAVLAIDPTSPVTGGAVLGDRVRMRGHEDDGGVFIRSLATRGGSGGVAGASLEAAALLERAGFDIVLLETVGVGQLEIEVVEEADLVLLLLSPESGDTIQLLKGGVMEVVDQVIVNKADRPGADALLSTASELAHERGDAPPLAVSAVTEDGVADLVSVILERVAALRAAPDGKRSLRRVCRRLERRLEERWLTRAWAGIGGRESVVRLATEIVAGRHGLESALDSLLEPPEERDESGPNGGK